MALHFTLGYFGKRNGARIAFGTAGSGSPVVFIPGWVTSLEHSEQDLLVAAISRHHRVIVYDKQGTGLSSRELDVPAGFARHADEVIELIDHLGIEQAALIGASQSGPVAIDTAARYPTRVSRLFLLSSYACGIGLFKPDARRAMVELVRSHWGYGSRILTDMFNLHPSTEEAESFAAFMRASATPSVAADLLDEVYTADVSDSLSAVTAPTLIVHRRGDRAIPYRGSQQIAAGISGARLLPLDGAVHGLGALPDVPETVETILEFLAAGAGTESRRFRAVLFTDLQGSTSHTQQHGDLATQELVREHNRVVRAQLARHEGHEVKHTGDGIMAWFGSAAAAVAAGLAMQQQLVAAGIPVRIGINAGEPIDEDGDLFGTVVQLASRITGAAAAGDVLVSRVVKDLCAGKQFTFVADAPVVLRGFETPMELFRARGDAPEA